MHRARRKLGQVMEKGVLGMFLVQSHSADLGPEDRQ